MLQADVVLDAALALEAEPDATAVHVHVPGTQGGQAVGAVVAGVAVVADADQGGVEQRNRQGHHLVATEAGQAQLGVDVPAQPRQRLAGAAGARTCRHRVPRASAGGSGTACAHGRRGRWPGDGRWGRDRSRPRDRPAEWPACPAGGSPRRRRCAGRRHRNRRSACPAGVDGCPAGGRRRSRGRRAGRGYPVALRSCLGSEGKLACLGRCARWNVQPRCACSCS